MFTRLAGWSSQQCRTSAPAAWQQTVRPGSGQRDSAVHRFAIQAKARPGVALLEPVGGFGERAAG